MSASELNLRRRFLGWHGTMLCSLFVLEVPF